MADVTITVEPRISARMRGAVIGNFLSTAHAIASIGNHYPILITTLEPERIAQLRYVRQLLWEPAALLDQITYDGRPLQLTGTRRLLSKVAWHAIDTFKWEPDAGGEREALDALLQELEAPQLE